MSDIWVIDLACHDAACAPPPVGTGGSKGGPSKGATTVSPKSHERTKVPGGKWSDFKGVTDAELKAVVTFEHAGYASLPDAIRREDGAITLSAKLMDSTGYYVGDYIRIFKEGSKGEIYVEHDWFMIRQEVQGKGIGQAVNDNLMAFYREHGIDRIELNAGMDVGPFAWARQGYRLKHEEADSPHRSEQARREWAEDRIKLIRNNVTDPEFKKELTQLLNASNAGADVQPLHIAAIGQDRQDLHWQHPKYGDMWPGKDALVGRVSDARTNWYGVYYLEG